MLLAALSTASQALLTQDSLELPIEDDLRAEMVNRRMCDSAVGILYRLMTLYAPGGECGKTLTLTKLQNPTRCTDAQSAAEEFRAWERWKNHAALGAALLAFRRSSSVVLLLLSSPHFGS